MCLFGLSIQWPVNAELAVTHSSAHARAWFPLQSSEQGPRVAHVVPVASSLLTTEGPGASPWPSQLQAAGQEFRDTHSLSAHRRFHQTLREGEITG